MKSSGVTLLAIGGGLMFLSFALIAWFPSARTGAEVFVGEHTAFELGQYYFNHDDDPKGPYDVALAKKYYLQAVVEEPDNPHAVYQYGRIQFIEGNFDEALETFALLEKRFGDRIPNMFYMRGLVYGYKARLSNSSEDWEEAENAFQTFITYAPTSPWPRVDLAWVHFAQGKFEEMTPVIEEGLTYFPDNPWLLNMYGLALLNTGEQQAAHATFVQALTVAEKLTEADWGASYPGNDPQLWGRGLAEFKSLIQKNIDISSSTAQEDI